MADTRRIALDKTEKAEEKNIQNSLSGGVEIVGKIAEGVVLQKRTVYKVFEPPQQNYSRISQTVSANNSRSHGACISPLR